MLVHHAVRGLSLLNIHTQRRAATTTAVALSFCYTAHIRSLVTVT